MKKLFKFIGVVVMALTLLSVNLSVSAHPFHDDPPPTVPPTPPPPPGK